MQVLLSQGEKIPLLIDFDTSEEYPQEYNKDAGGILTLRMYKSLKPIIMACNGPAVGV